VQLEPSAGRDLTTLAKRLKTLGDGRTVPAQFRKTLRTAATPAQRAAKAAARALPANGARTSTGLRDTIARATTVQVKLGGDPRVAVRISKRAMGPRASLPRLMNRGAWKHPVYGHRPLVAQISRPGWYDQVMRAAGPGVKRDLERTMDTFERRLMS